MKACWSIARTSPAIAVGRRSRSPDEAAPYLISVENAVTHDRAFSSTNDDYVAIWFECARADLTAADVFPRVGPYGAHPVLLQNIGGAVWQVNCKLPPGLAPGWHAATVRTADSAWAKPVRIGVDLPREERRRPPRAPKLPVSASPSRPMARLGSAT